MNKRIIFTLIVLIGINSIQAEESGIQQEGQEKIVVPKESVAPAPKPPTQKPSVHKPKPAAKPNIVKSFCKFLRIFISLLNNERIQSNLKAIEQLLTGIMQTAYLAIQNSPSPAFLAKRNSFDSERALGPEIMQELEPIIRQESRQLTITRKAQKPDEQTQEILKHFSNVVQNFFNIVQDPENKEVVVPNLVGMLSSIVNIGAEAMKKNGPPLNAELEEIEQYVQSLDPELKKSILHIITSAQEQVTLCN